MFKLIKIKNIFSSYNRVEKHSILGTGPFDKETDYKIEEYSPLAYSLEKNEDLTNKDIREAIHNMPDLSGEVKLEQMSKADFFQLSYMDCLPNVVNNNDKQKNRQLKKDRKTNH